MSSCSTSPPVERCPLKFLHLFFSSLSHAGVGDLNILAENQRKWSQRGLRFGWSNYQRHCVAGNRTRIPGRVSGRPRADEEKNLTRQIEAPRRVELNRLFNRPFKAGTGHSRLKITHLNANVIPTPHAYWAVRRTNQETEAVAY